MRGPAFFLAPLLAALLAAAASQEPQRPYPPQKHEVSVRLILVDVIVTRDGDFVKDLTREDFEIFEDGRPVPVNSFELVSYDERDLEPPGESPERPAPDRGGRRLAVIFDSINTWRKELNEGGGRIVSELKELIRLGHEVMILDLDSMRGVTVLQPFTTDPDEIGVAVERASGRLWDLGQDVAPAHQRSTETESDITDQTRALLMQFEQEKNNALEEARRGNYFEDMQRIDFILQERERFEKTAGGILAAFNLVKDFPGRKTVLLISAGIPDLSPPDMLPNLRSGVETDQFHDPYRKVIFGRMDQIKVFDPFNILGERTFQSGEEVIRELIRFANTHNISLYTMDAGIFVRRLFSGASAEYYQQSEMTQFGYRAGDRIRKLQNLRWLAEDTGADSLRGSDKLANFRRVMESDLKYHYQLSFYPRRQESDNRFHKLEVKVRRKGVKVRSRQGYTDYSEAESNRLLLVSAFYNPSLYRQLPFRGEIIPFVSASGRYQPWMNVALPAGDLIRDRFIDHAPRTYALHIWIKDLIGGDEGYSGRSRIVLNLSPSFMDLIRNIDFISYHFIGPEFNFDRTFYSGVLALYDPLTGEIGTWESPLVFPDLEKTGTRTLICCTAGELTRDAPPETGDFVLSLADGGLSYSTLRFFPRITNQFKQWEAPALFVQVRCPAGRTGFHPDITLESEGSEPLRLSSGPAAETWNEAVKVWSGLYSLDLVGAPPGPGLLKFRLPGEDGSPPLERNLEISILR